MKNHSCGASKEAKNLVLTMLDSIHKNRNTKSSAGLLIVIGYI